MPPLPDMPKFQTPLGTLHFWSLSVIFELSVVLPCPHGVQGFWQGLLKCIAVGRTLLSPPTDYKVQYQASSSSATVETLSLFQNHLQSSVSLSSKCNKFVKFAEIIAKNAGIRACAFPGPISGGGS